MSNWPQVTYSYDGTFAGFLTCVSESLSRHESPFSFVPLGEEQFSVYPIRCITTHPSRAKQQYADLKTKLSPEARRLITYSFLTCLPQRERHIYDYIAFGYLHGVLQDLTDDRVLILTNAVRHLTSEAHLLKGFTRFSDYQGVLVGEITPKNRVLPLLRTHFCSRYAQESFLLYDRTHQEGLLHTPDCSQILPLEALQLDAPTQEEVDYRQLWRLFYDTIEIKARHNPKLRMTHMPKRYWANMTEFQQDASANNPSSS